MNDLNTFTPPHNPGDTLKRVLVIKLGALGDFVQALGAMRVVRATHPSARITLLTTPPYEAFAKACPYFDIVESDGRPRDLKGKADLIRRLRAAGYDMVYDFQNNDRTAQYFAGLTGKKPLWSGAASGASHMHRNPNRAAMHNFDRLTEQLLHAGLGPKPPGDPTGWITGQDLAPSLDWIRPAFRDPPRFQPEFFNLYGPYMLLIPGSSAEHPEKRWPMDRFAAIAKWVADAGVTPVVIGGKDEGDIGNQILKLEPRARNIVGRTDLFQLATLAERAVLAVGGDTGPMHLAAAARCPGVCLFAQEWTHQMAGELQTVWNPQTRLGRAAPRGGPMVLLHAETLDSLGVDDVKFAALSMGVMPPSTVRPVRKTEAPPAEEGADPAPDAASAQDVSPPDLGTESGPRLAQGSDS
ncbi:MAG TPA: glycosyltransferase family 9 protein [Hyphomonadaceae bacterium]|nr:glycosyltransferase family 9 protein [Hyphomonadaceae bacterium]